MKVAIDPGHGGSDPGAVGPAGTREADVTLAVSLHLRELLEKDSYTVVLTRETDTAVAGVEASAVEELQARCEIANAARADIFVSIHCNAAGSQAARGAETWYYLAGEDLARSVQRELAALGLVDRGIKQGSFYVLRHTDMPAVLVELAFISNPDEEALLASEDFQTFLAEAITKGINAYLKAG